MANDILLLWFTTFLSGGMVLLRWKGILKAWPSVCIVSFVSSISMLALFYSPLYGMNYYMINVIKIEPLIVLLVILARIDPSPNWSYRAMCWILILHIITDGMHVLTNLDFIYFDQFSLTTSILEILVLLFGGLNVRFTLMGKLISRTHSVSDIGTCSTWAKRDNQRGR